MIRLINLVIQSVLNLTGESQIWRISRISASMQQDI